MPAAAQRLASRLRVEDLLLILILTLLALRLLLPLAVGVLSSALIDPGADNARLIVTVFALAVQSFFMLMAVVFVAQVRRGLTWQDLGLVRCQQTWIVRAVVFALLMIPVVSLTNLLVQIIQGGNFQNPQLKVLAPSGFSWDAYLSVLVLSAVIVPVTEEIVFRGLFFAWLKGRVGLTAGAGISAVVFALLHGVPQLIPSLSILGVALAYLYEKSGSVWPSIFMHATFNGLMTSLLYYSLAQGLEL
jgi:hypothetical protein|tara:strand:- start:802 stop:1539 length:738 start_codon:yes stop_codon:yes gene_type:complete